MHRAVLFTSTLRSTADHWVTDRKFAAEHNNNSIAKSTSSSSSSSTSPGKLPCKLWVDPLADLVAVLDAAGVPRLPDVCADLDLQQLVDAARALAEKEPASKSKTAEVDLVHPCVADALEKLFGALQAKATDPAHTRLIESVWLYVEFRAKHKKLSRLPDAARATVRLTKSRSRRWCCRSR